MRASDGNGVTQQTKWKKINGRKEQILASLSQPQRPSEVLIANTLLLFMAAVLNSVPLISVFQHILQPEHMSCTTSWSQWHSSRAKMLSMCSSVSLGLSKELGQKTIPNCFLSVNVVEVHENQQSWNGVSKLTFKCLKPYSTLCAVKRCVKFSSPSLLSVKKFDSKNK